MWPLTRPAVLIERRAAARHVNPAPRHLRYPDVGHLISRPPGIPRLASVTAPDYRTGLRLRRHPPGHRRAQADSWPKVIAWQRSDPPATGPAAFTRAVHNNPGRLIRRPARTARQPRSGRETPQVVVTTRNIGRCHPAGHGSRRVVDLGNCRKSFPNHRRDRCRLRVRRTRRWDQSERGVRHGRNSFSTFCLPRHFPMPGKNQARQEWRS
jgi:hypothetical protein